MTISQNVLNNLLNDCKKYKEHIIGTEDLKTSVWETARTLSGTDEKDLRDFLRQAEGQLDMIQFTCEDVFEESLGIVSEIMEKIDVRTKPVSDPDKISVETDRGEIQIWIEPETGFFMKTVTESGDFVKLTGDKARELAKILAAMADRADRLPDMNKAAV